MTPERKTEQYPERKHPRLKGHDYGQSGFYFVTIDADRRQQIFSKIVYDVRHCDSEFDTAPVGRGLAPAAQSSQTKWYFGGYGVETTWVGQIAECMINEIEKRYLSVKIDRYVIMPNHIHMVLMIDNPENTAGASPRPTLMDVICAYKSLITRACNQKYGKNGQKIFQTSFYEHVIRNQESYYKILRYIDENPIRWEIDGKEPF